MIGAGGVYAAGDVTGFPIKQGGIATQEADVAAEPSPSRPVASSSRRPSTRSCAACSGPAREPRYLYGRPTGGHGEVSTLSEEPPSSEPEGKVVGRYLSPFLDSLSDDGGQGPVFGCAVDLRFGS